MCFNFGEKLHINDHVHLAAGALAVEALRDHVDARRVRQHVRATSLQRNMLSLILYST